MDELEQRADANHIGEHELVRDAGGLSRRQQGQLADEGKRRSLAEHCNSKTQRAGGVSELGQAQQH